MYKNNLTPRKRKYNKKHSKERVNVGQLLFLYQRNIIQHFIYKVWGEIFVYFLYVQYKQKYTNIVPTLLPCLKFYLHQKWSD